MHYLNSLFVLAASLCCCYAAQSSFDENTYIPNGQYVFEFHATYNEENNGGWISHNDRNYLKNSFHQTFMGVGGSTESMFDKSTKTFPNTTVIVSNSYLQEGNIINLTQSFNGKFIISNSCNAVDVRANNNSTFIFLINKPIVLADLTYQRSFSNSELNNLGYNCLSSFYYNYEGAKVKLRISETLIVKPRKVVLYAYDINHRYKNTETEAYTAYLPSEDDVTVEMTTGFPYQIYKPVYGTTHQPYKRFPSYLFLYDADYPEYPPCLCFNGFDIYSENDFVRMIEDSVRIIVDYDDSGFYTPVEHNVVTFEPRLSAPGVAVEVVAPKCNGDKGYVNVTLSKEPKPNDQLNLTIELKGTEDGDPRNINVEDISKYTTIEIPESGIYIVKISGKWKDKRGVVRDYYYSAPRHQAEFNMPSAPPAVEITNVGKSDVKCYGGKDGSISFSVENAQNGYTATLKNIDGSYSDTQENTIQFAGLDVGTYTLSVTDGKGCNAQESVTKEITQNEPLDFSVSGVDATQYGKPDGVLNFNHVTGGCAPYSVSWRSDDAEVEGDVIIPYPFSSSYVVNNSLQSGHYTVEVMDHNGCTGSSEIDIHQPIALNIDKRNVTCYGYSDGMISVSLDGGEPPYSVTVSSIDDSENYKVENHTLKLQDLRAGDYNVTATDIANRTSSTDVSLSQHGNIEVSIPDEITVCKGQTVRVGVDKPALENIYKWYRDDEYLTNGDSIDVTDGGLYSVIASDGLCSDTSTMQVIKSPKEVSCDWIVASTVKKNGLVRLANITRENFTSYQWHYPQEAGIEIVEEGDRYLDMRFSAEGEYMLGMSSYHDGCKETVYKKVEVVDAPFIAGDYDDEGLSIKRFSVSPNPSDGNVSVSLELSKTSDAEIRICDFVKGVQVAETLNLTGSDKYFERMSLSLTAGMYIMVLMLPENSIRQTFKLIIK